MYNIKLIRSMSIYFTRLLSFINKKLKKIYFEYNYFEKYYLTQLYYDVIY